MALNKIEMAQRWAEIVIERFQSRMAALEVGDTGELLKSFQSQVVADSNGDPQKITFAFLYYGRFPDIGVGRGVKLGDRSTARQPKPWYSDVFLKEVHKLGVFMAAKYGIEAARAMSAFNGVTFGVSKNDQAWYNIQMNR